MLPRLNEARYYYQREKRVFYYRGSGGKFVMFVFNDVYDDMLNDDVIEVVSERSSGGELTM